MTLLATSTPEKRNTVRILFYGQSITEQKWWQAVADPTLETVVTLAQGLANTKHRLEIAGDPATPIAAVRVYRPPLRP